MIADFESSRVGACDGLARALDWMWSQDAQMTFPHEQKKLFARTPAKSHVLMFKESD